MPTNGRNIYQAARNAAGLTQERAAEMIGVSCRCLADYEAGQRMPANDVVVRMVDVYDARYLAYQHLRESSEMARRIIPDAGVLELPEAVLTLISCVYEFADDRIDRQLIAIAQDGLIDEDERPRFDAAVKKIEKIVQAALAVVYNGAASERGATSCS